MHLKSSNVRSCQKGVMDWLWDCCTPVGINVHMTFTPRYCCFAHDTHVLKVFDHLRDLDLVHGQRHCSMAAMAIAIPPFGGFSSLYVLTRICVKKVTLCETFSPLNG